MEDVTCGLSELEIDQKEKRFHQFFIDILGLTRPEYRNHEWTKSDFGEVDEDAIDAKNEITTRDEYEAKVSEADLETVQLRYIPDYIRELRTKEDYWKKEYNFWGDVISKKNWEMYKKKVKDEMVRNKTVLLNLDKKAARLCPEEGKTHFSQSLDPERVQRLVDYIRQKESDDVRFSTWKRLAIYTMQMIKTYYQDYAIFSRYGDFRARPSWLNLAKLAEEESRNLTQNQTDNVL